MTLELQSSLFDSPETVALMDKVSDTPLVPIGELFACQNSEILYDIRYKVVRSFHGLYLHDAFSWDFIRLSRFDAWKGMALDQAVRHAWVHVHAWMKEVRLMYQEKEKSDRAGYLFLTLSDESEDS